MRPLAGQADCTARLPVWRAWRRVGHQYDRRASDRSGRRSRGHPQRTPDMDGAAGTAADQPSGCRSGEGRLLPIATCATSGGGEAAVGIRATELGQTEHPAPGRGHRTTGCASGSTMTETKPTNGVDGEQQPVGADGLDGSEEATQPRPSAWRPGASSWAPRSPSAPAPGLPPASMQRTGVADPTEIERRR